MEIGDLHRAEVPFRDNPSQKKRRVVLIVQENARRNEVVVVESRGSPHAHQNLIGVVDFSRRGYVGHGVGGKSHFYVENIRILPKSVIDSSPIGGLTPADYKVFFEKIDKAKIQLLSADPPVMPAGTGTVNGQLPPNPPTTSVS
jgi:hypothetical protein